VRQSRLAEHWREQRLARRAVVVEALHATIESGVRPDYETVRRIAKWCSTASAGELRDLLDELFPGSTR
jgi:predicted transcriptional regulator